MFAVSVQTAWRSGHSRLAESRCTVSLRTKLHPSAAKPRYNRFSRRERRDFTRLSADRNGQRTSKVLASAICLCFCVTGAGFWSYQTRHITFNDTSIMKVQASRPYLENDASRSWKGKFYPSLDATAATAKLRESESSTKFLSTRDTDATSFDTIRLPSNNPVEDQFSYGTIDVSETEEWKVWGVYDGHAGWPTSKILRTALATYVTQELRHAQVAAAADAATSTLSPEAIDRAIKTGFLKLDDEIMSDGLKALNEAKTHAEAISRIAPARAGSCALMAIFDPANSTLRVACVGDSRAVLGRRRHRRGDDQNDTTTTTTQTSSYTYTAEPLSTDQTGFNQDEVTRISTAHPNEPDLIDKTTGRLLGLAITRAFGDHRWKWSHDDIVQCQSGFYGPRPRPNYNTPPYLTAEPEITTTRIAPGDFLILASDGLWDQMTNEHAVECVSTWIETYRAKPNNDNKSSTITELQKKATTLSLSTPDPNPSSPTTEKSSKPAEYDWTFKGTPEHFCVQDDNVATHLVRNALGGSRTDLFCSVMTLQAPESRNVRDDITVQVVFFGDVLGASTSS